MSLFTCCFWWFVLGALVGWLLSWLFNRLFGRTEVHEIADTTRVAAPVAPLPVAAATRVDDLRRPVPSCSSRVAMIPWICSRERRRIFCRR